MTWPQFKKKWSRYTGKESSAYQEHFKDAEYLLLKEDAADYGGPGDRAFDATSSAPISTARCRKPVPA